MNEHLFALCIFLALATFGGPVIVVQQRLGWLDYMATGALRPRIKLFGLLFYIWSRSHQSLRDRFLSRWVWIARAGTLAGSIIFYTSTRAMMD